jgi:transcriptional regulator with XRE-family HTH domain
MVKTQHDTSRFTSFGLLLDTLLHKKKMSYRGLAIASGMSATSAMTIIRACRGESTPEWGNILKWCEVLEATPEQRRALLGAFHYKDDEQERDLEQAHARIAELEQDLVQANMRIRELEQALAQLKKSNGQ